MRGRTTIGEAECCERTESPAKPHRPPAGGAENYRQGVASGGRIFAACGKGDFTRPLARAAMASRAWLVILVALACALSGVSCRSLRLSKDVLPRKNLAGGLLLLSSARMHLLSTGSPSQFADKGIPSPSKSALECVNPIQYDER